MVPSKLCVIEKALIDSVFKSEEFLQELDKGHVYLKLFVLKAPSFSSSSTFSSFHVWHGVYFPSTAICNSEEV